MKMTPTVDLPADKIRQLYNSGNWWSIRRLAKKYGVTDYCMKKFMDENGIKRRSKILKSEMDIKMIKKFLKPYVLQDKKRVTNELFLARRLIKQCRKEDFWNFVELDFKLNSLAFFLTLKGQGILRQRYAEYKYKVKERPKVKIEEEKIGEDMEINYKPKSIHEFLKLDNG